MKTVEILPGKSSSRLGFGCAPIMGSVGKEDSLAALGLAFELGVTHFDVAPSYGYGEAEKVLGEFLKGKRDRTVVVTKFGIKVKAAAVLGRPLKSIVRKGLNVFRGTSPKKAGTKIGANLHEHVPITSDGLVKSLERSLRNLQTERIDALLLHDPIELIEEPERLMTTVEKLITEGKLGGFGLAAMPENLGKHEAMIPLCNVVQTAAPDSDDDYQVALAQPPHILFSPFNLSKSGLCEPSMVLPKLRDDFPGSVILCSMFSEHHIRVNASHFS